MTDWGSVHLVVCPVFLTLGDTFAGKRLRQGLDELKQWDLYTQPRQDPSYF